MTMGGLDRGGDLRLACCWLDRGFLPMFTAGSAAIAATIGPHTFRAAGVRPSRGQIWTATVLCALASCAWPCETTLGLPYHTWTLNR